MRREEMLREDPTLTFWFGVFLGFLADGLPVKRITVKRLSGKPERRDLHDDDPRGLRTLPAS